MTHIPTTERTWLSETLDRRVKLSEVPLLSDSELNAFGLELLDVRTSVSEQIRHYGDSANPEWRKRADWKCRVANLFATACRTEAHNRDIARQLSCAKLKTERQAENTRLRDSRSAQYAKVFHGLIADEIGEERAEACRQRANQIVDAMMNQTQ